MDPVTGFLKIVVGGFILLSIYKPTSESIRERMYRYKTGDSTLSIKQVSKEDFSELVENTKLEIGITTYEEVLNKFKKYVLYHRTHKLLHKNDYNNKTFYFNKEFNIGFEKINYFENEKVRGFVRIKEYYVYFFFRDNVLSNYLILNCKYNSFGGNETCTQSDKHFKNYLDFTNLGSCNWYYYVIVSLGDLRFSLSGGCNFAEKQYWDDPEIEWEKIYLDKPDLPTWMPLPCKEILFASCDHLKDIKTRKQKLQEELEKKNQDELQKKLKEQEVEKAKSEINQVPEIKLDQ